MADMKNTIITIIAIFTLILGGCEKEEIIVEKEIHDTIYSSIPQETDNDTVEYSDSTIFMKFWDIELPVNIQRDQFIDNIYEADYLDKLLYSAKDSNLIVYNILLPRLIDNHDNMFIYFDQETGEFSHLRCNYTLPDHGDKVSHLQTAYDYFNYLFDTKWDYDPVYNENFLGAEIYHHNWGLWFGIEWDEENNFIYYKMRTK